MGEIVVVPEDAADLQEGALFFLFERGAPAFHSRFLAVGGAHLTPETRGGFLLGGADGSHPLIEGGEEQGAQLQVFLEWPCGKEPLRCLGLQGGRCFLERGAPFLDGEELHPQILGRGEYLPEGREPAGELVILGGGLCHRFLRLIHSAQLFREPLQGDLVGLGERRPLVGEPRQLAARFGFALGLARLQLGDGGGNLRALVEEGALLPLEAVYLLDVPEVFFAEVGLLPAEPPEVGLRFLQAPRFEGDGGAVGLPAEPPGEVMEAREEDALGGGIGEANRRVFLHRLASAGEVSH